MKVSIIIPTYNSKDYIYKAILSVLSQKYPHFELLIIDSSEKIPSAIHTISTFISSDERINYYKAPAHSDVVFAINWGIQLSTGEYIAILDDDDYWIHDCKITDQVNFLNANKDHVLVGTNTIYVDESGEKLYEVYQPKTDKEIRNKMLRNNNFIHSSILFTKKAIIAAGGYKTIKAVDYLPILNLGLQGKMANIQSFSTCHVVRQRGLKMLYRRQIEAQITQVKLAYQYRHKYPNFWKSLFIKIYIFSFLLQEITLNLPPLNYIKNYLMKQKKLWSFLLKTRRKLLI